MKELKLEANSMWMIKLILKKNCEGPNDITCICKGLKYIFNI